GPGHRGTPGTRRSSSCPRAAGQGRGPGGHAPPTPTGLDGVSRPGRGPGVATAPGMHASPCHNHYGRPNRHRPDRTTPVTVTGRRSDLEQLGLLVLEHLVDLGDVLLGELVELLLRPPGLVLADLALLDQLVEGVLGVAADVAHRDAAVLRLRPRHLHVLLAALLRQLGEHHPDDLTVVARVHPEVAVPDRALDGGQRVLVEGLDDDQAGLGHVEGRELLDRGRRAVVLGGDLTEHRGRDPAGADAGELLPRDLHRLVHLFLGFEECFVDHRGSLFSRRTHQRADLLTAYRTQDVTLAHQVEDHDGKAVVHAQADRGGVHDPHTAGEDLTVVEPVKPYGIGVRARIGVVHAVHLGALQQRFRPDLECALGRARVGGEEGRAETRTEDHNAALLQVADR